MQHEDVFDKLLAIHRADGSLSWRALHHFCFEPALANFTLAELFTLREKMLAEGLIQYADEKQDITVLTPKARRKPNKKPQFLKLILGSINPKKQLVKR